MPRTRRGFVLLWTAILIMTLAFQYAAAATPGSALAGGSTSDCDSFAIYTTDVNGDTVNANHYDSKPEVYLNGGPSHGVGLTAGTKLYYQVQEPDGTPLMEIRSIVLSSDGTFRVQLYPFDTTSNSGGEYKVVVSTEADLSEGGCTKSDNFKVDGPGSLKITKTVEGGPANVSGDFDVHVDCGDAGSFNRTISFPDPGFVTITGIDAKAHCTVTETDTPNAPSGYSWGDATFTGNPATISSGHTVTVGVVNHLDVVPAPALTVDKGVSLSADGPFAASLTTTTGTTVHYRITVTNTGNVTLHGVTLTDNTFDLVAKGCTIPTTLAVGAHFDCDYTAVAATGTTTNIATGDSSETDSDTGTATVTANPAAAPALSVEKSVALSATGPWVDHVTVQTGTTVFFKITVTNTGNTNLTSVTLSDNTFDLVAKGCTIPTTLAMGASFDCAYSAEAVAGDHTNTATANSEEAGPETDTATVTGTTPNLRVRKAVSTSATGPFINILNVAPGTTVFYRITVTNTGDMALSGVTLSDNTFDLVAKGCTIPTTLAIDASFDCDYSSVSAETSTVNTATADSNETGPETDDATVNPVAQQAAPSLNVDKTVALSATGPWVDQVNVLTGTTVFFKITVTNTGDEDLTAITLSDNTYDLVAMGCTIPTTLAVGAHFDCTYSTTAATGTTTNTATADSAETGPDTDTATVLATATPPPAGLTIDKTNNAPLVNVGGTNLPTASEGSTVTFTLSYAHTGSASTDGTITDVLPAGLTYVTGSATGSADFTFSGYDAGTRTLTWTASEGVSASGSVTYQAKVDKGAAALEQPLENVATIDSSDTTPDSDVSDVFVAVPPLAETDNPNVPTAPQTDIAGPGATAAPGANLGFVLLIIGILAFAVLFVTPMPAVTRSKIRRR